MKVPEPLVSGLTRPTARRPELSHGSTGSSACEAEVHDRRCGAPDADLATAESTRWWSAT